MSTHTKTAATAIIAAAVILTGCGNPPHHPAAPRLSIAPQATVTATADPLATTTPAPQPTSCQAQFLTWSKVGLPLSHLITGALRRVGRAADAGSLLDADVAMDELSALAGQGLRYSPPACVTGMRPAWKHAMRDYRAAARAANAGDIPGATVYTRAADIWIQTATTDLQNWKALTGA